MKSAGDHLLPLYGAAAMRAIDRYAIEQAGIPAYELMTRAARAAWTAVRARYPDARRIQVLCGAGNNGGDGFVLARLAAADGCEVQLVLAGDADRLVEAAAQARDDWVAAGGAITAPDAAAACAPELVVDALLGTGCSGDLRGDVLLLAQHANALAVPVVALDLPTGLSADTGDAVAHAVAADLTVTFIGHKPGLYTGAGPDCCGERVFDDLDVPADAYAAGAPLAYLDPCTRVNPFRTPRRRDAHKGVHGRVLVVGGNLAMPGAVRLAGEAALRSGAGLVTLATRPQHAVALAAACPELIAYAVDDGRDLVPLLAQADVVVIGPGLGRDDWGRSLCSAVFESDRPLVVDADALNLLAAEPQARGDWILTPHPGEAARLLGLAAAAVQADRPAAVRALQARFDGTVVLKGAGTLVCTPQRTTICAAGNPGMATAGMGDVLSGVIAALHAQGLSLADAARAGVGLHAVAGDLAAEFGERGLLARDVIGSLADVLNS